MLDRRLIVKVILIVAVGLLAHAVLPKFSGGQYRRNEMVIAVLVIVAARVALRRLR